MTVRQEITPVANFSSVPPVSTCAPASWFSPVAAAACSSFSCTATSHHLFRRHLQRAPKVTLSGDLWLEICDGTGVDLPGFPINQSDACSSKAAIRMRSWSASQAVVVSPAPTRCAAVGGTGLSAVSAAAQHGPSALLFSG